MYFWFALCLGMIMAHEIKADNAGKEKLASQVEVPATEDLMKEHGLLNRILLIYEEVLKRLHENKPFRFILLYEAATIVREFVEDYHEKLEEQYIFSRFEKSENKEHKELVRILKEQHDAGRQLTDCVFACIAKHKKLTPTCREVLIKNLTDFIAMYRVHEAREDTVLFPAFHELITLKEYEKLSDLFEETEEELFGEHGYEKMLAQVENIEKELEIYDIEKVTPKIDGCGLKE